MIASAKSQLLDTIKSLASVPTAPFREQWVLARLDSLLAEIPNLEVQIDTFGNRIARLTKGSVTAPPAYFVAHLDHPGFLFLNGEARACSHSPYRYEAVFEGRVLSSYFENGPVRLYRSADDVGVPARVVEAEEEGRDTGYRRIVLETRESADGAWLGMWDLPAFDVADGIVHSRACDDLVGCAAIIDALRLLSCEENIDVGVIFSRGEESGFCGVLCLLNEPELHPLVDPNGAFISVENSSELAGSPIGSGAIIRLGDRASTFDAHLTDRLWTAARTNRISARRVLMDRGTCEATPFAKAGLRAGGICVPLRNYHNQDYDSGRIAMEAIAQSDAENLVQLIRHYALAECQGAEAVDPIDMDYSLYLEKGRQLLDGGERGAQASSLCLPQQR